MRWSAPLNRWQWTVGKRIGRKRGVDVGATGWAYARFAGYGRLAGLTIWKKPSILAVRLEPVTSCL